MSTTFNRKSWSFEESCQLIELYKGAPHLWNPNHTDYKNRNKRRLSLNEFGIALKVSPEEVERKIKIICSQYRRERRNFIKHQILHPNREFRSRWFGYNLMSFLNEVDDERRKIKTEMNSYSTNHIDLQNDVACSDKTSPNPSDNETFDDEPQTSKKRPRFDKERLINEAFMALQETTRDEFTVYGEYVAMKLRKLDTETFLRTQNEINNVLHRAEFNMYFQK